MKNHTGLKTVRSWFITCMFADFSIDLEQEDDS